MALIELIVYGDPQPQGNKTAFVRGGRAVMVEGRRPEAREKFHGWRAAIAAEARLWLATNGAPAPIDDAVAIVATFHMARPKTLPKRVLYPLSRPDLDKLERAVLDAITKILITNDSRVVRLWCDKVFAVNSPPRAVIRISREINQC